MLTFLPIRFISKTVDISDMKNVIYLEEEISINISRRWLNWTFSWILQSFKVKIQTSNMFFKNLSNLNGFKVKNQVKNNLLKTISESIFDHSRQRTHQFTYHPHTKAPWYKLPSKICSKESDAFEILES